jgi:hypothetical protein
MTQFESTVTVGRPVEEVFDLVLDLGNAGYFDPAVESVRRATPGAIRVGTVYEFREPVPPFGRVGAASATYTAIEPASRAAFDFRVGSLRGHGAFHFERTALGARITFRGRMRPPAPLRPLAPLLARQGRRVWDARLGFIRDWVEAGAPRDGSWPADRTGGAR